MCGIAGWVKLDRSIITPDKERKLGDAMLTRVAVRGTDASGALLITGGAPLLFKEAVGSDLLVKEAGYDALWSAGSPGMAFFHARATTKGTEKANPNNHPVVYRDHYLIHNGVINNDDDLKQGYADVPEVDTAGLICGLLSEAGPTLDRIVELSGKVRGSMSCALWNKEEPDKAWLWCNKGRPLAFCFDVHYRLLAFASTLHILSKAMDTLGTGYFKYFGTALYTEPDNNVFELSAKGIMNRKVLKDELPYVAPVYKGSSAQSDFADGWSGVDWQHTHWDRDKQCYVSDVPAPDPDVNEDMFKDMRGKTLTRREAVEYGRSVTLLTKAIKRGMGKMSLWEQHDAYRKVKTKALELDLTPLPDITVGETASAENLFDVQLQDIMYVEPDEYIYLYDVRGRVAPLYSPKAGFVAEGRDLRDHIGGFTTCKRLRYEMLETEVR